jgi:polyhydroxybutyrate depolymerase
VPLVFSFHGHGSTAIAQEKLSGFSSLADQMGFLAVYPQGVVGRDGKTGWSTGPPKDPTVDDVGYVGALLTHLQATLCVDSARVYATGFSNGGGMTALLACTMDERIAAFVAVAGSYYPLAHGCHPRRSVPLLEIHGTADPVVPYDGSALLRLPPITEWLAQWAERDGCAHGPSVFLRRPAVVEEQWTGCRAGGQVVHYARLGGAHVWAAYLFAPGAAEPAPATSVIWAFLVVHSLDAPLSGIFATAHGRMATLLTRSA